MYCKQFEAPFLWNTDLHYTVNIFVSFITMTYNVSRYAQDACTFGLPPGRFRLERSKGYEIKSKFPWSYFQNSSTISANFFSSSFKNLNLASTSVWNKQKHLPGCYLQNFM